MQDDSDPLRITRVRRVGTHRPRPRSPAGDASHVRHVACLREWRVRVDPRTFDGMIRKLSGSLSRRSLVGGSLGASVLAAIGLGEETLAKKVTAEACIPTGKRCPSKKPRGRTGKNGKPKKLSCNQCCQRRVTQNAKGQNICHCAPEGEACTETRECCDGRCIGGVCTNSIICRAGEITCSADSLQPCCPAATPVCCPAGFPVPCCNATDSCVDDPNAPCD